MNKLMKYLTLLMLVAVPCTGVQADLFCRRNRIIASGLLCAGSAAAWILLQKKIGDMRECVARNSLVTKEFQDKLKALENYRNIAVAATCATGLWFGVEGILALVNRYSGKDSVKDSGVNDDKRLVWDLKKEWSGNEDCNMKKWDNGKEIVYVVNVYPKIRDCAKMDEYNMILHMRKPVAEHSEGSISNYKLLARIEASYIRNIHECIPYGVLSKELIDECMGTFRSEIDSHARYVLKEYGAKVEFSKNWPRRADQK